ncbi:UNVERIFIED_CONTAM: hypothetical protein Sindi_0448400 [Sesamum indicum]
MGNGKLAIAPDRDDLPVARPLGVDIVPRFEWAVKARYRGLTRTQTSWRGGRRPEEAGRRGKAARSGCARNKAGEAKAKAEAEVAGGAW